MAATIKPIEAKSVHQIQSGQVIVDLCSVVKELVENSLDAEATNIEVRFKNNGLDSIEVQDNGSGISESNYDSIALKHYTSKLSNYDDLSTLNTFGFRGEALSSLCALSTFTIITAEAHEAPRGKRLEFKDSGRIQSSTLVAAQKGTTTSVENLFDKLPVRRKELSKNIKREYGKVLGLLHAYACISTQVKFSVKNTMPKGKSVVVFSTKGNSTTRENVANVYGAKMLSQLLEVDLELDLQPSPTQLNRHNVQMTKTVVKGHISKPIFGEGRQTPDRQMFFVNGRPCGLPQIAKAINEVYKSYNVSQSPFIFADFQMDTNSYDVNVSPDKRSILLHDAAALIEQLKRNLTDAFDRTDQTVPQSQIQPPKLPAFRKLSIHHGDSAESSDSPPRPLSAESSHAEEIGHRTDPKTPSLFREHFQHFTSSRPEEVEEMEDRSKEKFRKAQQKQAERIAKVVEKNAEKWERTDEYAEADESIEGPQGKTTSEEERTPIHIHVQDFNARIAEQQRPKLGGSKTAEPEDDTEDASVPQIFQSSKDSKGVVQNAFDRMRPRRAPADVATITIGDRTITKIIGSQSSPPDVEAASTNPSSSHKRRRIDEIPTRFSQNLRRFGAPGTQGADEDAATTEHHDIDEVSEDTQDEEVDEGLQIPELFDQNQNGEENSPNSDSESETSDLDYMDDSERKAAEEARVAQLIQQAEENASEPSKQTQRRTAQALKGGQSKDSTTNLVALAEISLDNLKKLGLLTKVDSKSKKPSSRKEHDDETETEQNAEERLSLTVSKSDFANMHIAGQFNLGFIIAVRSKALQADASGRNRRDELFIIDQHASDEKYNFERLQAETVVGNQRLVHPVALDLTAIEEEVILENGEALERNGFLVEMDTSGDLAVGQRCRLVGLPLSKEVVFDTRDLDELIHLLAESPMISESAAVPRPSKVRKMFAMRACRSSIMIGKTLSRRQMSSVLQHMGSIDKPWNCPHGRPTMRHLISLDSLDERLWHEGDGVCSADKRRNTEPGQLWRQYIS